MTNRPQQPARILPAEWEPHKATWLGWPSNPNDWPGKFSPIRWAFAEIVKRIAPSETVRIVAPNERREREARQTLRRCGIDDEGVEFFRLPLNRGWMRDCMPAFVKSPPDGETLAVKFQFNAWAKYDDWTFDDALPAALAERLGWRVTFAEAAGKPFVLEGGAFDVNGRGTLLTTEECLLDQGAQARNPGLGKREIEEALRDALGVTNVVWLGKGIAGDDTHGHVDDLCRFVNPTTVALALETNPRDENYAALQENRERLEDMRLEDGSRPDIATLPMPAPVVFDGMRLPASYANFYCCNAAVLAPTFNDPNDRLALGLLAELIPDRPVIGVYAGDLVWGLGTLHCLTHEEPR